MSAGGPAGLKLNPPEGMVGGLPSGAANEVIATPNGAAGVSALRHLVWADLATLPGIIQIEAYYTGAGLVEDVGGAWVTPGTSSAGIPATSVTPPAVPRLYTFLGTGSWTLIGMTVSMLQGPGGMNTVVFTVYKNGVVTSNTITVTGAGLTGADTTHTVSFTTGDFVSILASTAAGSPANINMVLQITRTA